jgi:CBS domain-containing membrane protein
MPWLRALWPAPVRVDAGERLRAVLGAAIGILITGLVCHFVGGEAARAWPWLVAPMGASAVLVFAVPASPMAQPWAVIVGNTLSALVGIACVNVLGHSEAAAALAVGGAIGVMFITRSLHPPGGASALLMVLTSMSDPRFALVPMLLNSVLLVSAGIVFNNASGRRYPHAQLATVKSEPGAKQGATEADLDAVLARYNQVLDISRDDLEALIQQTLAMGVQRKLAEVRCSDIMSREVVTVEFGTSLEDAWALLRERKIKALPVVDRVYRIVGILTMADFMRAAELDLHEGFDVKLRDLIRRSGKTHSDKPEVVGQIMTRRVRVASEHRSLMEMVPLFGSTGHHHIPIIGEGERLVGILTQSDVVAALSAGEGRSAA